MPLALVTAASLTPYQFGTMSNPGRLASDASSYTRRPANSVSPIDHETGSTTIAACTGAIDRHSNAAEIQRRFMWVLRCGGMAMVGDLGLRDRQDASERRSSEGRRGFGDRATKRHRARDAARL